MKERPILFKGEMVRAILEGRKTQTRRLIKPQPDHMDDKRRWLSVFSDLEHKYGVIGDRLWVKETWIYETEQGCRTGGIIYRATERPEQDGDFKLKWKPSLFMSRAASRINLEIIGLRIEPLNEISESDAQAEGWKKRTDLPQYHSAHFDAALDWYQDLWNEINGPRSWEKNPWVWVIEFRRLPHG